MFENFNHSALRLGAPGALAQRLLPKHQGHYVDAH